MPTSQKDIYGVDCSTNSQGGHIVTRNGLPIKRCLTFEEAMEMAFPGWSPAILTDTLKGGSE